jgi:hypothetical protein
VSFVPDADKALPVVPAKLNYLLVQDAGKARFFRLFGFDPTRPQELDSALRWHLYNQHYSDVTTTVHGVMYEVTCRVPSPNKRNPCIVSVWMVDAGQTIPRFITAYPNP